MTHIRAGLVLVQSIKLILTNTFSIPAYADVAFKYGIIRLDMVQSALQTVALNPNPKPNHRSV